MLIRKKFPIQFSSLSDSFVHRILKFLKNPIMTLASKEMVEKNKHKETVKDRNTSTGGVVITVYEESVTPRSRKQSQDPIKKTKPHPHFTRPRAAPTTHGYDRRAQLLAHSRQLRNYAASQKVPIPLPTIQSQTKSKVSSLWFLSNTDNVLMEMEAMHDEY